MDRFNNKIVRKMYFDSIVFIIAFLNPSPWIYQRDGINKISK